MIEIFFFSVVDGVGVILVVAERGSDIGRVNALVNGFSLSPRSGISRIHPLMRAHLSFWYNSFDVRIIPGSRIIAVSFFRRLDIFEGNGTLGGMRDETNAFLGLLFQHRVNLLSIG